MTVFFTFKRQSTLFRSMLLAMLLTATGVLSATHAKAQAMAGSYTVCASGCDYKTVSAAAADLKSRGISASVTINIKSGSYKENVSISGISGVAAGKTVTFRGTGRYSTRIAGNGGSNGGVVEVRNQNYINFKQMMIEDTSSSTTHSALHLYYSNTCMVDSCVLQAPKSPSSANYALYNYYCIGNTFTNNVIRGGYDVIYNYGASSSTTYGYHVFRNNWVTQTYYHTFYNYYVAGCVYDHNYVDSAVTTVTYGFYSYYENGAKYTNNTVPGYSFTSAGIYINYPNYYDQSVPFEVYNNIVGPFTNTTTNYAVYYYQSYAVSDNFFFEHNTVHIDNTSGTNFYMSTNSSTGGNTIANNIFSRNGAGQLARFNDLKATDVLKYNDYYSTATSSIVYYNGTTYNTISDFVTAAAAQGHAIGSQTTQPVYKSATNLHLDQSKAAPFGRYAGISTDIDGDKRCNSFPTAGADEAAITTNANAKVSGFSGPDTVYVNSPVDFTNKGNAASQAYEWYYNGTKIASSVNLTLTAGTSGTFPLRLVAVNCSGRDSITKNIVVIAPTKAPEASFISNANIINQGETVQFTDLSTNGPTTWQWSISPDTVFVNGTKTATYTYVSGSAKSANPQVKFLRSGAYNVCLTTSNGVGASNKVCRSRYIIVNTAINLGSQATTSDSVGTLYDDGGPNGPYSNNFRGNILISPCATKVFLTFKSFDLECSWDYLRIYDGIDNKGIPLHKCTTNTGSANGPGLTSGPSSSATCANACIPLTTDTFVANSGKMYIEMASDGSGAYNGFEAHWWSTPKTGTKPHASFTVDADTICTNGYVTFTNTSTGDDLSYIWDLDGDPSAYECMGNNCHITSWPYIFPGQYTATLIATNPCGGTDTFRKTIVVNDPPAPKASFMADNLTPAMGSTVFFSATVKECVDDYTWTIEPGNTTGKATFVNGTNSASSNPQVSFSDTGCYTIKLKVGNVKAEDSISMPCYIHVKKAYCKPAVTNIISDLSISRVVLNTLDYSSGGVQSGYSNFLDAASTRLEIGITYDLTVYRKTANNPITRTVWIDWNSDGDFDDAGEKVAEETNSMSTSWKTTVTVPAYANKGATVMRIAVNQGNYANKACGDNKYGEFEDYRLYITEDRTKPVITLKGADTIRVEQGYTFTDPGATAADNIDGNITSLINVDKHLVGDASIAFDPLSQGTYVFTYTVMDRAKNSAEPKTRIVIITPDVTSPDLQVEEPDTIYVAVDSTYTPLQVISAYDLLDGNVIGNVVTNDPVDTTVVDTFTVTYSVTDFNGNTATVTRTVIVEDTTAPVITMAGSDIVYANVNESYSDAGATVSDNYYSPAELMKRLVVKNTVNIHKIGTYTVTYDLTDPSGNKAIPRVRTVIVQDTMKPEVTLVGSGTVNLEVFDRYADAGLILKDNYYSNGSLKIDTGGTFYDAFPNGTATKLGKYTVVYNVTDSSGNTTTVTRTIMVVDTKAPVIALKGSEDTIVCRWDNYMDAGYTVTDNYNTMADIKVDTGGTFRNTLLDGFYTITYRATDESGNVSATVKRTVSIRTPEACGTSGIKGMSDLNKAVNVYPNPSNGLFTVSASLAQAKEVRVVVTDLMGKAVLTVDHQVLGMNQFQLDMRDKAAGVYLMNIYTDSQVITKRITISK